MPGCPRTAWATIPRCRPPPRARRTEGGGVPCPRGMDRGLRAVYGKRWPLRPGNSASDARKSPSGISSRSAAANPDDADLALRDDAPRGVVGPDKEFADTCRRALDFHHGNIRSPDGRTNGQDLLNIPHAGQDPGSDPPSRASLARRWISARTITGSPGSRWPSAWPNTAVVISRRRTAALIAAATGGKDNPRVLRTSVFYRAMVSCRQGKEKEAFQLPPRGRLRDEAAPQEREEPSDRQCRARGTDLIVG